VENPVENWRSNAASALTFAASMQSALSQGRPAEASPTLNFWAQMDKASPSWRAWIGCVTAATKGLLKKCGKQARQISGCRKSQWNKRKNPMTCRLLKSV